MRLLVYFAARAGVIHYYWLVKSDVRLPLLYGVLLYRVVVAFLHGRGEQTSNGL